MLNIEIGKRSNNNGRCIYISWGGKLRPEAMVENNPSTPGLDTPVCLKNGLSLLMLWQEVQEFPRSSEGWAFFISLDKFGGRQISQENLRIVTRLGSSHVAEKNILSRQCFQEAFLPLGTWGRGLWRKEKAGKRITSLLHGICTHMSTLSFCSSCF